MDFVLFVGVGMAAALATWELVRRAVLGNRMDRSFEALKAGTRQMASRDDVVIHRTPLRAGVAVITVHHSQGPKASNEESPAELIAATVRNVPLHARLAS